MALLVQLALLALADVRVATAVGPAVGWRILVPDVEESGFIVQRISFLTSSGELGRSAGCSPIANPPNVIDDLADINEAEGELYAKPGTSPGPVYLGVRCPTPQAVVKVQLFFFMDPALQIIVQLQRSSTSQWTTIQHASGAYSGMLFTVFDAGRNATPPSPQIRAPAWAGPRFVQEGSKSKGWRVARISGDSYWDVARVKFLAADGELRPQGPEGCKIVESASPHSSDQAFQEQGAWLGMRDTKTGLFYIGLVCPTDQVVLRVEVQTDPGEGSTYSVQVVLLQALWENEWATVRETGLSLTSAAPQTVYEARRGTPQAVYGARAGFLAPPAGAEPAAPRNAAALVPCLVPLGAVLLVMCALACVLASRRVRWALRGIADPAWCAISVDQLLELRRMAREALGKDYGSATMHDVNRAVLQPMCAREGVCFAWALNRWRPLHVQVFVSHAWSENFESFVQSVTGAFAHWPVKPSLWICATALLQTTDKAVLASQVGTGSDPSRAPFTRALSKASKLLIVRNDAVDLYQRIWCCWELYLADQLGLLNVAGSVLVAGPDTFAGSDVDVGSAGASNPTDKDRILKRMLAKSSLADINAKLTLIRSHAHEGA